MLKPVVSDPLPKMLEIDVNRLPDLPTYEPSLKLRFERSKSFLQGLSQLDTFQKLLTSSIIDRIVESTNSYTENVRNTDFEEEEDPESFSRSWKPVNTIDI